MLERALVEQFYRIIYAYERNSDLVNEKALPLLDLHPELAHVRISDYVESLGLPESRNALHIAAQQGNLALMRWLIAMGADVNFPDRIAAVPLHNTMEWGTGTAEEFDPSKVKFMEVLLEAGADPNRQTVYGDTPLHTAVQRPDDALYAPMIGLLLRYGADPNILNEKGTAPIHMLKCNAEALDQMVIHGGDLNLPDEYGRTGLMQAFLHGCSVAPLLKHGANIHARDQNRMTPLHYYALGRRQKESVEMLLQAGSKPDARDRYGYTPLHLAASQCLHPHAQLLLDAGADINAKSHRGETPLALVKAKKALLNFSKCSDAEYKSMAAFLEKSGADPVEVKSSKRDIAPPVPPSSEHYAETAELLRQAGAQK